MPSLSLASHVRVKSGFARISIITLIVAISCINQDAVEKVEHSKDLAN